MNALEDRVLSIFCSDVFLSVMQNCDQHIVRAVSLFFYFPGFFFFFFLVGVVIVLKFLFLTYGFYSFSLNNLKIIICSPLSYCSFKSIY